ncbi:hypothetical protein FQN53_006790 [Emmonsiellopsis sp. PD_33]|nr:hypothetical protein FQN53_006790 [Emmonsiellopsis sp. PD_33]
MAEPNPLVSSKSSESGLQIQLHPLVLLNISDHITRHIARQQKGPVVGALLGLQNGRIISLEHVFECKLVRDEQYSIDETWFQERLQQFRDVHKDPPLDLVGWFTVTPPSGPTEEQLPIHRQILQKYNETAILLTFDAASLKSTTQTTGKLPLSIFESTYEEENVGDGDKSMQVDGQQPSLTLKFRELPYSIETGEAEMISVDFVARGGGNATAIQAAAAPKPKPKAEEKKTKGKKGKKGKDTVEADEAPTEEVSALSHEDEDLIANLNTRLNAVKTLESRLSLIKAYLSNISNSNPNTSPTATPEISHSLLRNIHSLISHLSLLTPQESGTFSTESLAQTNDVALVALLGSLGQSVQGMRELGKKFAVVDGMRQNARSGKASGFSQMEEEFYLQHGAAGGGMGGMQMWD